MSDRIDIEELERVAKAATPGPWRLGDWSAVFGTFEDPRNMRVIERNATHQGPEPYRVGRADGRIGVLRLEECPNESGGNDAANVTFIAAANPTTVLALIARVRELEERIDSYEASAYERSERD